MSDAGWPDMADSLHSLEYDADPDGRGDGLATVGRGELDSCAAEGLFDRRLRDAEDHGHVPVAFAGCGPGETFALPRRQGRLLLALPLPPQPHGAGDRIAGNRRDGRSACRAKFDGVAGKADSGYFTLK